MGIGVLRTRMWFMWPQHERRKSFSYVCGYGWTLALVRRFNLHHYVFFFVLKSPTFTIEESVSQTITEWICNAVVIIIFLSFHFWLFTQNIFIYVNVCTQLCTFMYKKCLSSLHYAHQSYRNKTIFSGELRNKFTCFVFLIIKHLAGIEMKNINLETVYKNIWIFLALSNFLAHIPWQQILFLNERIFLIRIWWKLEVGNRVQLCRAISSKSCIYNVLLEEWCKLQFQSLFCALVSND